MWPDIMYDTVNANGLNKPMLPFDAEWPANANSGVAIYYIAVTLVCGFLMLNVFVGVVIDEYNAMKGEEDGSGLMTDSQKQWVSKYKSEGAAREWSTVVVVDISIPPPSFKPVSWSLSRISSILKHPNKSFFNPIKYI